MLHHWTLLLIGSGITSAGAVLFGGNPESPRAVRNSVFGATLLLAGLGIALLSV